MSFDKRITTGWVIVLTALWVVLHFVFHVKHAWIWPLIVVVAVGINGFILTYFDD